MTAAAIDVPTIRAQLRDIAEQIRADITGRQKVDARTREWASMLLEYRMALLLLAGVDGDLQALARKAWGEFTDDEKIALRVSMRGMFAALEQSVSLRARGAV